MKKCDVCKDDITPCILLEDGDIGIRVYKGKMIPHGPGIWHHARNGVRKDLEHPAVLAEEPPQIEILLTGEE